MVALFKELVTLALIKRLLDKLAGSARKRKEFCSLKAAELFKTPN